MVKCSQIKGLDLNSGPTASYGAKEYTPFSFAARMKKRLIEKMAIAIAATYLIAGIVTARFLEKKRMRAAAVLYTVLFVLIAFFLLLILESGWAADCSRALYGDRFYGALREAFVKKPIGMPLSAALIAEEICLAMLFFSLIAALHSLAEKISAKPKAERVGETVENHYETVTETEAVWLKFCRIRS